MRFDTIRLFMWKDRVYANKPSTLEHLNTNIRQVTAQSVVKSGRKLPQKIQ